MLQSIEADAAREQLLQLPAAREKETVELKDAMGRVLAEDLTACVPMPPFHRSPLDGYAVRWQDTIDASPEHPVRLRVVEELPAGKAPTQAVTPGTAAQIFTGAPMPEGADSVIKYEEVCTDGADVLLSAPLKPCQNVVYQGEEAEQGTLLLPAGTVLGPAELGVLASQGKAQCTVWQRPKVVLLTTGSELAPLGQPLRGGQIYDSNGPMISALLEQSGLSCVKVQCLPDRLEEIAAAIEAAWHTADLVLTIGGASVGDYDFAVAAARQVNADILFWKVKMKPGSCILAAKRGEKVLISLSGNPGAAAVCLLRVVCPYLNQLCGKREIFPETVFLPLKEAMSKKSPVMRLLRGHLEIDHGKAVFAQNPKQGNGMITSLCGFELLGEIPAGSPALEAGQMIRAYRFS